MRDHRDDRDMALIAARRRTRAAGTASGLSERGQSLVEFALVFPIIVFVLLGIFDMGRAVFAFNTVSNAARQGARVAAVNQLAPPTSNTNCIESMPVEDPLDPTWSARACAAAAAANLGVGPGDVTIGYAKPAGTNLDCVSDLHVGCIASVSVTYQWSAITPVIGNLLGPIAISSTSQIPVERVFP